MRTGWKRLAAGFAGVIWGTPVFAAGWQGAVLFAQAEATAPAPTPTRSGTDFVFPGLAVIVLFGLCVFAVCRSSNRV